MERGGMKVECWGRVLDEMGAGGGEGKIGRVKGERNRWRGRVGAEKGLWKRSGMQYKGEKVVPSCVAVGCVLRRTYMMDVRHSVEPQSSTVQSLS